MRFRLKSGLSIGYRTRGRGPVVVMLHPIGMNGKFWDPVIDEIDADFRGLAFDMRGHGESDVPPEGFTLAQLADDIAEATAVLAEGGPCIVAGCSLGGMVAQALALRHPRVVRALLLTNTSHTLPDAGRRMMRERAAAALKGMPEVADLTIDRWFSAGFRADSPSIVAATREYLLRIDPVIHARAWEAISELDHADRLAEIQVPTIAATGSEDVSTPPAAAKAIAAAVPGAIYREAEGAGHLTPIERPGLTADWIRYLAARAG